MLRSSPLAHRHGLTLTEALVAMFIAALGMIALMTLFPLGALQMGQALKDHRCTETAVNAEALMRLEWLDHSGVNPTTSIAYLTALDSVATGPSNPVFVDPIGIKSGAGATAFGGAFTRVVSATSATSDTSPRSDILVINNGHIRACSLLDDFTFDNASSAGEVVGKNSFAAGSPGTVERAGRYNWLAVLQRPSNSIKTLCDLTILVFDGRSPGYTPPNAESSFSVTPTVGATSVSINTGGASVQVAKGRWIGLWTSGGTRAARFLSFYRVVAVDDSVANTLTLELQAPIKGGHTHQVTSPDVAPTTNVLVFSGLAEVFERPGLTGN
jgi:Tfp pilus assembly protein PilV